MKKITENKNVFGIKEVIFLIILTCLISICMGYNIAKHQKIDEILEPVDSNLQEFIDNYEYIVDNYYEDVDKEKLIMGAVDGMIESLEDIHSVSISNENYFNIQLSGKYNGLGIEIVTDSENHIIIYNIIDNSPASKAGLQVLDEILEIDGKTFEDSTKLGTYVKESDHNSFQIKILRDNQTLEFTLQKENIVLESVYYEMLEKNNKKIGYIYISLFATNTVEQFINAVSVLENDGMESLIIDVRENSGGRLTTVVDMLSCLLDSSKTIYQIEIKNNIQKYNSNGTTTKKYPIVVLQNKNSASASELLSSALKEQYGATIIGETSYGKGTVQQLVKLSNGKEYKLTTKKWLTSNGTWINEKGVSPDIEISLDDEYQNNPSIETDNQLQKALEYLTT